MDNVLYNRLIEQLFLKIKKIYINKYSAAKLNLILYIDGEFLSATIILY